MTEGNYKGVMLCNRPGDNGPGMGAANINPAIDAPRFRPVGLPMEPLGLNPARENVISNVLAMERECQRRRAEMPPSKGVDYIKKHRLWLAEMARKKAALNAELEESAKVAAQRRKRFVQYSQEQKLAIASELMHNAASSELDQVATGGDFEPSSSPPAHKPTKTVTLASKPKWAMTEKVAENVEDGEADDLLAFASNLNYDSYIDDLEVRQALGVIRDRIDQEKALQAAAEAMELAEETGKPDNWEDEFVGKWNNDKAPSEAGSLRSNRDAPADADPNKDEWDASTMMSETTRLIPADVRHAAEELLKANPSLAAKHSVKSLVAAAATATATREVKE